MKGNNILKPAHLCGKVLLLQARSRLATSVGWRWFGPKKTDVTLHVCHRLVSVNNEVNRRRWLDFLISERAVVTLGLRVQGGDRIGSWWLDG